MGRGDRGPSRPGTGGRFGGRRLARGDRPHPRVAQARTTPVRARTLPEAEEEIRVAAQWYEDQQAGLGEQFLEAIVDGLLAIERHPRRFARYTRLRDVPRITTPGVNPVSVRDHV